MQERRKRRNEEASRRRIDLLRRNANRPRKRTIRMRLAQFSRDIEIQTKGHACIICTCEWFKRSHCVGLWPARLRGAALPRMQMILFTNTAAPSSRKLVNWLAGMRIRRDCRRAPAAALCAPLQNRLAYQLVDELFLAECTWRIRSNYAVCFRESVSVSLHAFIYQEIRTGD